uniref:Laminin G domain-containing protein n=2 Tax=Tetranychus urticae TaxID=32264 RepID=T1L145_TETUR
MLIDLGEEAITQSEDLNLRFKTSTSTSFLFMASTTDRWTSYLIISLEGGRLKVTINLGEGNKVTYIGSSLGNDRWHTIRLHRRGPSLEVKCDSENVITELTGQLIDLHYSYLVIGSYIDLRPGTVRPTNLINASGKQNETPNFIGSIHNLILNGNDFIELSKQKIDLNFTVTATYGKKDGSIHRPITFKSRRTYIGLPQLKAYSTMALYFQFKTTLPNGLILYNGGKDEDFIAIELVAGQLHYTFNMGDGQRRLKSSTRYSLNDGQWHSVAVGRPSLGQHTLMVDDMVSSFTNNGPNLHLDLTGLLYLGGLPSDAYSTLPSLVVSSHGFEGCLASLDFNGETIDPTGTDAVVRSTLVSKGCSGEGSVECLPGKEDGSCDSLVALGSPVNCIPSEDCSCDDNQSSSSKCSQSLGSASYQWGSKGGLVLFTFPDKKLDTKNDHLSVAFSTESDNCVLFRVDSGSSIDYMELSIFDGTILMVYNLGTEDHDIGQLDVKVNDGKVHLVRFTRTGSNSTLQVDNHNVVKKTPSGRRQLTVFNSHHKIQIGGKMNTVKDYLEKPFTGIISGLLYNGYRLLDLAMDNDPRIEFKGDVLLVTSTGNPRKESKSKPNESFKPEDNLVENTSSNKEDSDSLIFSGEGSGDCFDENDDDDEGCEIKTVKETEIDELITPKLVESSEKPTWTNEPIGSWATVSTSPTIVRPCNPNSEDCSSSTSRSFTPQIDGSTVQLGSPEKVTSISETYERVPQSSTSLAPWIEPEKSTYGWYQPSTPSTTSPSTLFPKIPILPPIQYQPMRPRPQTPTRPTGKPPINVVPIPQIPNIPNDLDKRNPNIGTYDKSKPKTSLTTASSADKTAWLIGFVAVTLVIIVILTPMILYSYIKYQNDHYYKGQPGNDSMAGADLNRMKFNPITGVPTMLSSDADLEGNIYHGSSRSNVSHIISVETAKASKKKDTREWYV